MTHLLTTPRLTQALLCMVPVAVQAQASQPSQPSQPSTLSTPSTPTLPATPSQPAGIPYPSSIFHPGAAFQPAGTQASAVSRELSPGLQLRAMAGAERESNVLRASSGGISDTAFILGIGLRADRRFGLQRFRADVEANTYRYANASELDYNVLNYALAWDWSFTPRLHGVLAADRKQYRDVAIDPVELVNRVGRRTERSELIEGVYEAGARWRLTGSASHARSSSTQAASWDASPDLVSARIGAGYEWPSGSSLYARYRRGDGEYTDPSPGAARGAFQENEADLVLSWPVTGKTSISARLGHLERRHENGFQRDFGGMVGNAALAWDVTGKTRVVAGAGRELSATGLATGGHVRSDRLFAGPIWKASALIAVNLRYDQVWRNWKDVPAASPEVGRNESVRMLSAAVEWEPRRWLAVSGYIRTERQQSSLNAGYRNNTVGAAVKAFF